jgi:hypothetical protein
MFTKLRRANQPVDLGLEFVRTKVGEAPIYEEPFPHVAIPDLLRSDVFQALSGAIPKPSSFKVGKSDLKLDLDITDSSPEFSAMPAHAQRLWLGARDEIVRNTVAPLLGERFRSWLTEKYEFLFGPDVAADVLSHGMESTHGRIMGRRPGYALHPHLDSAHFGITCLLYFTSAGDADSGALCLYRPARKLEVKHASTYYPDRDEGVEVELAKTIPVRENLFVAFLNGPSALHGFRVEQGAAGADRLRFVYQAHLVPRDFEIGRIYDRLSGAERARWEQLMERRASKVKG